MVASLCSTDLLRAPEAKQLHRPQPQGSHCSSEGKPRTETYTGGKTATSQTEDETKGEGTPIRVDGEKSQTFLLEENNFQATPLSSRSTFGISLII